MASSQVFPPFQVFTDLDGAPLDAGFIYIGEVNQNPQANPIPVFWDIDLTIPAVQPIRTVSGYPSRDGTPARLYASQPLYSIMVRDRSGVFVYSSFNSVTSTDLEARLADNTTFDNGAGMVGLYGAVEGRSVQTALEDIRKVEDFGTVGSGNDTPVLQLAFAWLAGAPGRTIELEAGRTYIQGPGANAVIYEGNPYFPCRFDFSGVDNLSIRGNGSIIQADPTLSDNQFNRGFQFSACHNIDIRDLTYDGRLDARTPFGGDLNNGGNELTGNRKSGFAFYDCDNIRATRIFGRRCMMDGIFMGSVNSTNPGSRHGMFNDCSADQCYRQGMSITAAEHTVLINPKMTNTGSLGPTKGTLPMGGIDLESNFDTQPVLGTVIIGGECSGNLDGLIFQRASQDSVVMGVRFIENRGRGISSPAGSFAATKRNNRVIGGAIIQTLPSVEVDTYAVYIGGSRLIIDGVNILVANPHRGAVFLGAASSPASNCHVTRCNIEDVGANGAFNQILVHFQSLSTNCKVDQCRLANATGTLGWHALIESTSATFLDSRVASGHGASGARGVSVGGGTEIRGIEVAGVSTSGTSELAGINIAAGTTLLRKLGPNIDQINPRLGMQIRNVGFPSNVLVGLDPGYNAANVPANSSIFVTFTSADTGMSQLAGAQIGDSVFVDLEVTSDLFCEGRVLSAGSIRVEFRNNTAVDINPGPTNLRIRVTAP
jgi:hypothetical protein